MCYLCKIIELYKNFLFICNNISDKINKIHQINILNILLALLNAKPIYPGLILSKSPPIGR